MLGHAEAAPLLRLTCRVHLGHAGLDAPLGQLQLQPVLILLTARHERGRLQHTEGRSSGAGARSSRGRLQGGGRLLQVQALQPPAPLPAGHTQAHRTVPWRVALPASAIFCRGQTQGAAAAAQIRGSVGGRAAGRQAARLEPRAAPTCACRAQLGLPRRLTGLPGDASGPRRPPPALSQQFLPRALAELWPNWRRRRSRVPSWCSTPPSQAGASAHQVAGAAPQHYRGGSRWPPWRSGKAQWSVSVGGGEMGARTGAWGRGAPALDHPAPPASSPTPAACESSPRCRLLLPPQQPTPCLQEISVTAAAHARGGGRTEQAASERAAKRGGGRTEQAESKRQQVCDGVGALRKLRRGVRLLVGAERRRLAG